MNTQFCRRYIIPGNFAGFRLGPLGTDQLFKTPLTPGGNHNEDGMRHACYYVHPWARAFY